MNPLQQRAFNTTFGSVLLGLGLTAWAVSVYFAVAPKIALPPPQVIAAVDTASCQSALTELGYSVTERGTEILAFEQLSSFPKEQLEKASVAATICHLPMQSFCIGEACERPGLSLSLKKSEEPAPATVPVSSKGSQAQVSAAGVNPQSSAPAGIP